MDRNGRELKLGNGDFFIGGLSLTHTYYPKIEKLNARKIYLNLGSRLGFNTTHYNISADVGAFVNGLKTWNLNAKNQLSLGLVTAYLHKDITRGKGNVDFGNNGFLISYGSSLEFTRFVSSKNYHAFAVHYNEYSGYHKSEERDFYAIDGNEDLGFQGWHYGVTRLHRALMALNFTYTYAFKPYKISLYVSEDTRINNAPDFQAGINLSVQL